MRLDAVEFRALDIPRKEPFRIATGMSTVSRGVVLRVCVDGTAGWGWSAANSVTGEDQASITEALTTLAGNLAGIEFSEPGSLFKQAGALAPEGPAAVAGFDMAVHDAIARLGGMALCDYLGRVRDCQMTDVTLGIGDMADTVRGALAWKSRGIRALKVKVGLDLEGDIRRVEAVRDAVGPAVKLWVDANQGYTVEEALRFASETQHLDLEFMEQPVARHDLEALAAVRERSPLPVMADESVLGPDDARLVARMGCADMVNIKMMKCGGIHGALEIARICQDAGLPNMVGCMSEPSISIAGALHFALSQHNVRYADLDSHLLLAEDISPAPALADGTLHPLPGPGIGTEPYQSPF